MVSKHAYKCESCGAVIEIPPPVDKPEAVCDQCDTPLFKLSLPTRPSFGELLGSEVL